MRTAKPALVLLLLGCSSDPGPLNPGPVSNGGATIRADGGIIEVSDSAGAVLTLDFLRGAVLVDTPIEVVAATPASDVHATFQVLPAGLQLFEPVILTVTEPDGVVFDADTRITVGSGSDKVVLETTLLPNAVQAELLVLGFAGVAKMEGDFINVEQMNCQNALFILSTRIEQVKQTKFSVNTVYQLTLDYKAAQQCLGEIDSEAFAAEKSALQAAACEASGNAINDALVQVVDLNVGDTEAMHAFVEPVFGAQAAIELTDAQCGSEGEFLPSLGTIYDELVDNFIALANAPNFLSGPGAWQTKWGKHFGAGIAIVADTATLSLTAAKDKTEEQLFPALLDQFRVLAYDVATEENTQQYLADVLTAGFVYGNPIWGTPEVPEWANFSSDEVKQDIQYCLSRLEVAAFDAVVEPVDGESLILDGQAPGQFEDSGSLAVPADGFLEFSGLIYALYCAGGEGIAQYGDDILLIRVGDIILAENPQQNGLLLGSPVFVSVEEVLSGLGLPTTQDQSFTVEVIRQGAACAGVYGDPDFPLFTIEVETTDTSASVELDLEIPGLEWAYGTFPVELTVTLSEGGGEPDKMSPGVNLDVSLTIEGGTLAEDSGVTDVEGRFVTELTVADDAEEVTIEATVTTLDDIETKDSVTRPVYRGRAVLISHESTAIVRTRAGFVPTGDQVSAEDDDQVDQEQPDSFSGVLSANSPYSSSEGTATTTAECSYDYAIERDSAESFLVELSAAGANSIIAQANDPEFPFNQVVASAEARSTLDVSFMVEQYPIRVRVESEITATIPSLISASFDGPEGNLFESPSGEPLHTFTKELVFPPGTYSLRVTASSRGSIYTGQVSAESVHDISIDFSSPNPAP